MAAKKWIQASRFAIGMVMVQVIATGLQLLSRVILNEGTLIAALMAYRHIVGAVCVVPFAFFWERGGGKKLSWWAFFWLFAVAFTGISMAMELFYYGLRDTTATYATDFLNLIPIVTYVFSVILRAEKLQLHTIAGKTKSLGATFCLVGALIIAFYKDKSFHISHMGCFVHHSSSRIQKEPKHWTRGTIFLVCSCLCFGLWYITQEKLFKIFPYKFWATFYICIIATVQQVAIGLCLDRSKAAWHLARNLQLVTIFYSGALATAATFWITCWTVGERGPTYPSMFNPLSMIFVAITEALFLGEPITVGSLLGMAFIVIGLYLFIWAKNQELKAKALPVTESVGEGGKLSLHHPTTIARIAPSATNGINHVEEDKVQSSVLTA